MKKDLGKRLFHFLHFLEYKIFESRNTLYGPISRRLKQEPLLHKLGGRVCYKFQTTIPCLIYVLLIIRVLKVPFLKQFIKKTSCDHSLFCTCFKKSSGEHVSTSTSCDSISSHISSYLGSNKHHL